MKKSQDPKHVGLDLPEPSEEQIEIAKKMAKEKCGVVVPKTEAKKLAKLISEMDWWFKVEPKTSDPTAKVSEERIAELKDLFAKEYKREITMAEAQNLASGLLLLMPYQEKQRLSDEIRAILVTHKKVVPDIAVEKKVTELFKQEYGIDLTGDQLWQVIQFLSKTLWHEEGLDKSLDKCLADLMKIADKRKRGKRISGVDLHEKVMKAIETTVKKLAGV